MHGGLASTAADNLRPTLASTARWLVRLAVGAARRRSVNFLLLTPPYRSQQRVFDRRTGLTRTLSIRDASEYEALSRVFGDEDYRLDRLARNDDLMAAYQSIVAEGQTPLILDCGAATGLSARYFADSFPEAKIVAIEPDRERFLGATANCAVANVDLRQAAIASECRGARGGVGLPDTVSINSLVAEQYADRGRPFMIRIDIDSFEDELFSSNIEWIDEFPLVIVELSQWHLPARYRSRNILRALADADREFVFLGRYLFSVANDATTSAARLGFVAVPQRIAPYHAREAI